MMTLAFLDQLERGPCYVFMLDLLANAKVQETYHAPQDSPDDGPARRTQSVSRKLGMLLSGGDGHDIADGLGLQVLGVLVIQVDGERRIQSHGVGKVLWNGVLIEMCLR
jgi:hypothetical protein